jgi:hypothetical protein
MKFHKLYTRLLNPLVLLLFLSLMVIALLAISGVETLYASAGLSGISLEQSAAALWVTFSIVTLAFVFFLLTEILLVKRKKAGVVMLLFAYASGVAYSVYSMLQNMRTNMIVSLIINVVVCILVYIYYWKRSNLFD